MKKYIVREKWPGCKAWEAITMHADEESARAELAKRLYKAPDDGYKVKTPKGKIRVQLVTCEEFLF